MLTPEQEKRIQELQKLEILTPEQANELEELENLIEDKSDEYDKTWKELDDQENTKTGVKKTNKEDANSEKDQILASEQDVSAAATADAGQTAVPVKTPKEQDNSAVSTSADPRDQEIARLKQELADNQQRMRSWDGRIKVAENRAVELEAKLNEKESAKGQDTLGDVSLVVAKDPKLSAFFEEFPDLQDPIVRLVEVVTTNIVSSKLAKVDDIVAKQSENEKQEQEEKDRVHIEKIEKAHPDWKKIYSSGALENWIKLQPAYLQPRYSDIVERGSTEDVISMFDAYKQTMKTVTKTTTELSPEKKARVDAMQAVPAETAGPQIPEKEPDKNDYDGAWDHWEKRESDRKRR